MKIVSWFALVVSIVSLAFTMNVCFAQRMYDTNYIGIVISALGVIVTLLIGCNIYTIIDAKGFKKEVAETLDARKDEIEAMIHQMHAQSLFYNMYNPKEAVEQIMMAIEKSSKLDNHDTLISNVSFLARLSNDLNHKMIEYRRAVKFNQDAIDKYCQILKDTNYPQAIDLTAFIRNCT